MKNYEILLFVLALTYAMVHFIMVSHVSSNTSIGVDGGGQKRGGGGGRSLAAMVVPEGRSVGLVVRQQTGPPPPPQLRRQMQSQQQQQQSSPQTSVTVIIPGHGSPRRLPSLKRSLESLRASCQQPPHNNTTATANNNSNNSIQFECLVFVYKAEHLAKTIYELDFCQVFFNRGLWTDHMRRASAMIEKSLKNKRIDASRAHVVVMMDDIDATTVRLPALMETMTKVGYQAVSPTLPGWQTSSLLQRQHCFAHRSDHLDVLFVLMSQSAWQCWVQLIFRGISNHHGWGYDLTFSDICKIPLGIVDHEIARHDPEQCESGGDCSERSYNSTIARREMDRWLIDANVGVHNVEEADAYFKQVAFLRPNTFAYCDRIQLHLPSERFYQTTTHRGGWKSVMEGSIDLQVVSPTRNLQYNQSHYVDLVDCIEEWFLWERRGAINKAWVGITHMLTRDLLPDHQAEEPFLVLDTYLDSPEFASSASTCVALVFFTKEIEQAASKKLVANGFSNIRTCVIQHPIAVEDGVVEFSLTNDLPVILSAQSAVILLGQQYRRIATLHKMTTKRPKIWFPSRTDKEFIERKTQRELAIENVTFDASISVQRVESNDHYDRLVKQNIVIIDFWAAAANNAVMEAIALKAPFFIRRLPGPEEYLGKDYPLFFSSVEELDQIIANATRLEDALKRGYEYLRTIDRTNFSIEYFAKSLNDCALKGLNHEKAHPGTFPPGVSPPVAVVQ